MFTRVKIDNDAVESQRIRTANQDGQIMNEVAPSIDESIVKDQENQPKQKPSDRRLQYTLRRMTAKRRRTGHSRLDVPKIQPKRWVARC